MAEWFFVALSALCIILFAAVLLLARSNIRLRFALRSGSVKHGRTMEQMMPFSKSYPYDPRGFRFIGDPVDGVQFNDDGVVFIEFKTGNSALSEKQKRLRDNIEKKRVEFREVRSGG